MDKNIVLTGLLGLLIGDALGVPYEFHSAKEIPAWPDIDFEPPAAFSRTYPEILAGTWSDDGAQALCLLDSLIFCKKLDLEHFASNLLDWVDHGLWAVDQDVFDCGIQTMESLRVFAKGISPEKSGSVIPEGKGNGSLMRVLPLALWHCGSDGELVIDAQRQSLPTHGHPCNQVCCALYCLWARYIMNGSQPAKAYQQAAAFLADFYSDNEQYQYELQCCTAAGEPTGTGYVVDSIRSTLYLLNTYNCYQDVVKGAVALGNDTDTTAAIAGGLAAIAYQDIPDIWIHRLRNREAVEALVQKI